MQGSDSRNDSDEWTSAPTIVHATLRMRDHAGPYRLLDVIGTGGMGMVHRAVAPDGKPCAVKTLRPDLVDERMVSRFVREATVRIDHPNVIKVLDSGADGDGTPYIVFELLSGESFEHRLARAPITAAEAVGILLQACEGIGAVHDAGVVHRDIKPANIFLCEDGTVKVLDFGVAALATGPKMTATGALLGTPSYLSPEQARATADIDARTDVWALGAVLYEALCGRPPFEGESFFATVLAILMEPVPPLSSRAPELPSSLTSIVHRCLAKDRDARYRDVRTLANALRHFDRPDAGLGTAATQATRPMARQTGIPAGEERIVVVLMADGVRDHSAVEGAIREHGGDPLTRFGGSALGLFGGMRWTGDEPSRAVEAALAIRPFADRVSVASGRASSDGGGLAGAAVSAAERGCRADLAGVAVDASTARSLARGFTLEQVGHDLFEILERRPPSWIISRPDREERVMGREAQLAQLRFAFETALGEERAMIAFVTGPAGIGKTALRHEVEKMIADRGDPIRTFLARGEALYHDTAWSFLGSLLRRRAVAHGSSAVWPRLDPSASIEQRCEAVVRLASEAIDDDDEALECAEFLGEILGIRMPETVRLRAAREEPRLMADRIRLALTDWLAGHASKGPIALFLENVDWADASSLEVLEHVVEELAEAPLFVFVSARKAGGEDGRPLFSGRDTMNVALKGIPKASIAQLAASIAERELPDAIVEDIAERTEGNPLFVRELVMTLAEQGRLDKPDLGDAALPLSIEAAVQSRLDLLSLEERELCKRASLFGRPFSTDDLRAAGVDDAENLLAVLRRRDIVRRHVGGVGRRQYGFRSPLMGEVAYRMMAKSARTTLHRRVATYLAAWEGSDAEEVARHFDLGEAHDDAARWWARAALAAAQRGDSPSVLRCTDRAIELGAPEESRFRLHMARAEAYRFLLRREQQHEALQNALGDASSESQRAEALRQLAFWLTRAGRLDEATETGRFAVTDADASGDAVIRALTRCTLAQARVFAGAVDEADALLRDAESLATAAGPVVRAQIAEAKAFSASSQGDIGRAREACAEAAEQYGLAGHVREAAMLEQNVADAYNRVGAFAEAERALRDALEGCHRVKNRVGEAYALANLGYASTMLGKLDEALASLDQAAHLAAEMKDARLGVAVSVYRARAHLLRGAHQEALADAALAEQEAAKLGLPSLRVSALALSAMARLALGDLDAALGASDRALALRDELGGVEEDEADVFLARVRALDAVGRAAEAEAIRARGADRLMSLASKIADAELRRRFLENVPANRALASP